MNINDLLSEHASLADGDRVNGLTCPECDGGRSGERAFTIGRIGSSLWWKCWRASCGYSGRTADGKTDAAGTKKPKRRLNFTGEPLTYEQLDELAVKYQTPRPGLLAIGDWFYTQDYGGRVVMPVFARDGSRRGAVLRSLDKAAQPKVLNDMAEGVVPCAWFSSLYPKTLFLVEDIPSAVTLHALGGDAVALLGTSLTQDKLDDILTARPSKVVIALDEDAFSVAIKMLADNRHRLPSGSEVVRLTKDIKDMSPSERLELMEKYT